MTELLNDSIRQQIRGVFTELKEPVHILYFGSQENCASCADTRQMAEEVVALSDKLSLGIHDLQTEAILAQQYHMDKAPGMVIAAKNGEDISDYGIRLAGIPAGHEFTSLIQDILLVSGRDSGLSPATREYLKGLTKPVRLQVFVTPTCPYCPRAVVLAHRMALENPLVQAEMVEATEFPELADRYYVSGVPQTTINDGAENIVGAVPEENLLAAIRQVLQ
jgi:glutaredoxin-like protein